MNLAHWRYFISLDEDLLALSRYIAFTNSNFSTHSTENARLLMAAAQECDVLMKQICDRLGQPAGKEAEYRSVLPAHLPSLPNVEVEVLHTDENIVFKPFASYAATPATTPTWWTANNKVKHERHNRFADASLANVLEAVSALLILNVLWYVKFDAPAQGEFLYPVPQALDAGTLVASLTPTRVGLLINWQWP